jgi:hypothetical protein
MMSGTYTRYTVEDDEGLDVGTIWEQGEYYEARSYAKKIGGMVIAQEYAWEDSELVDDFRTGPAEED